MGKKKFIDKKKAATYRLVFKDSSELAYGDGQDRTFTRVDGGHVHVPGFDDDDESDGSIFEGEEEEEGVGEGEEGRGKNRSSHLRSNTASSATRQELIELGFPDDGYNYLQHLREIGPPGRTGSFIPNSNLRLDLLRPDIKAYDASKIHVLPSTEEARGDVFLVHGNASRLRGPIMKGIDPDVAALLEDGYDDQSLVSGDELEDDFVVIANDGVEKLRAPEFMIKNDKLEDALESVTEDSDTSEKPEINEEHERPERLLDEQFELLAMREYDADDIGELDYDDPQTRGHAHISRFDNVISDFLINTCVPQDKYQTPAEIQDIGKGKLNGGDINHSEKTDDIDSQKAGHILLEYESSEEAKELIIAEDTDSEDDVWDCETIVTTFSNLDNHPGKIYASDKGLSKGIAEGNKSIIRLRGKQQIPIDYLPRQKPDKERGYDKDRKSSEVQETKPCVRQRAGETKEEKKARKAAIKEGKRTARVAKKEMKILYKDESQRARHSAALTGPGTVHLS